jgi:ribonuclease Z
MYINYEIVVNEITAPTVVYADPEFYIRAFPLKHSKTCVGYTLEELDRPGEFDPAKATALKVPMGPLWGKLQHGESVLAEDGTRVTSEHVVGPPRSGRKFSFVTDTLYVPTIAKEVRGSDLLICEGMFSNNELEQALEKKHMTASQAATIARDAGVKQLALIHYSPRYTDHELPILRDEAQAIFPNTVLTRDRMVFPLPYEE